LEVLDIFELVSIGSLFVLEEQQAHRPLAACPHHTIPTSSIHPEVKKGNFRTESGSQSLDVPKSVIRRVSDSTKESLGDMMGLEEQQTLCLLGNLSEP
jgi:hypothetical protein